ncbi:MAG: hypothetical protein IJU23_12385 [Proteobacteria bacterium]|nr:hypothetical protein [Pseudomonadota bacterium]
MARHTRRLFSFAMTQIDSPHRRYHDLSRMLSGVVLIPFSDTPDDAADRFFIRDIDGAGLFCHKWSVQNIADTFLEAGCFRHWQDIGFSKLWIELPEPVCPERFDLEVWTNLGEHSELLMQLTVWLEYTHIDRLNASFPSFSVEHLRLQAPGLPVTRRLLPGQEFASSGMLRRMFGILQKWACELGAQLITEIPEYFHTAYIFGEYFTFADQEMELLFRKMKHDLLTDRRALAEVSSAFEEGRIVFQDKTWLWPTEMQAFALSHELAHRLAVDADYMDIPLFSRLGVHKNLASEAESSQ